MVIFSHSRNQHERNSKTKMSLWFEANGKKQCHVMGVALNAKRVRLTTGSHVTPLHPTCHLSLITTLRLFSFPAKKKKNVYIYLVLVELGLDFSVKETERVGPPHCTRVNSTPHSRNCDPPLLTKIRQPATWAPLSNQTHHLSLYFRRVIPRIDGPPVSSSQQSGQSGERWVPKQLPPSSYFSSFSLFLFF